MSYVTLFKFFFDKIKKPFGGGSVINKATMLIFFLQTWPGPKEFRLGSSHFYRISPNSVSEVPG